MAKTGQQKPEARSQNPTALPARPWAALPPELAAALRPGVPDTAEEIIETIRHVVPAYARPLEGGFGGAIRTGVERALCDFLEDAEGRPHAGEGGDIYEQLGRDEAREGRTMEALLAAYRVGARIAWRRASEVTRDAGFDSDMLSRLAEAFFAYIDELSARSVAGFTEEQSTVAGEAERRRRLLLGLMIQEPPAEPDAIEAAARDARWELPATLAALVWRDQSEQPVARRLPLGSLAAPLDDGLVCALVPDAGAPGRRAEVERALGRRAAALGPLVPAAEAWNSARRARALHRLLAEGLVDGKMATAEEHLAELVVHADRGLARELASTRLEPLEARTPGSRKRLLDTLAVWLDHQGHVPRAAQALGVHPQTVRYRLEQLRELFGGRLDDPQSRFELMLALRAPGPSGGR
ncbi:MAG: PucR family transcriptional regulator [Thermoleophilaceae bacterium]